MIGDIFISLNGKFGALKWPEFGRGYIIPYANASNTMGHSTIDQEVQNKLLKVRFL